MLLPPCTCSTHLCNTLQSTDTHHNEPLTHELVISGIAHLLKNNSELYKRFCLERCYDPDIRVRVMFMKAFTRVLHLGTQFDQGQINAPTDGLHTLCQVSHSAY